MSKPLRPFYLAFCVLIPLLACPAFSQGIEATIDVSSPAVSKVGISGSFVNEKGSRRHLSFLRSVAGIDGLPNRISDVSLFDAEKNPVSFRQLGPGEYLADRDFKNWTYTVDVTPNKNPNAAAHVSWYANGIGILMLTDLLPLYDGAKQPAAITFKPPIDLVSPGTWSIYHEQSIVDGQVEVTDLDNAVFYLGSRWRNGIGGIELVRGRKILSCCDWNFAQEDLDTSAQEIQDWYAKVFRSGAQDRPMIAIAKFPQPMTSGRWEAETRGSNVTIISSDMPFKQQSVQRLHEQLRHEVFHLWIPNGVNLTGKYDWFYEGFALYESLKMAVSMNRIRFADFLDTLSRAHTIDSAQSQGRVSLIDASTNRFSGSNTQVYARGMLVAFLVDLTLLEKSKGKRSVDDVLRELYVKYRKPAPAVDGNKAVTELLEANPGVADVVKKYVKGTDKVEWANEIALAGIVDGDAGPITTLKVEEKLSGRQKTLLDKLGYNNWRKLAPSSK